MNKRGDFLEGKVGYLVFAAIALLIILIIAALAMQGAFSGAGRIGTIVTTGG